MRLNFFLFEQNELEALKQKIGDIFRFVGKSSDIKQKSDTVLVVDPQTELFAHFVRIGPWVVVQVIIAIVGFSEANIAIIVIHLSNI